MRALWMFHRRLIIGVLFVALISLSATVVLAGNGHAPRTSRVASPQAHKRTANAPPRRPKPTSPPPPPRTAIQKRVDAELARAETPASLAAARAIDVPAPAASSAYPAIPAAEGSDPAAFAIAFAIELLSTNYLTQSRSALLGWAEYEEAPNTLPGIPAAVAGKSLVLSLADPDLPGATPSPTPSTQQWLFDAQDGVVQSVSDVGAEVDPDWSSIISQGWQPRDPRMTIETVTGTMSVASAGQVARSAPFSLTLTLGSAAHGRAGYGAVAVGDWTLG